MQKLPVLGAPPFQISADYVSAPLAQALGAVSPSAEPEKIEKLERRLHSKVGDAIVDFGLIEDGDRVMVCVSGGKDSYALLDLLLHLQRRAPIDFTLVAVNVDQGWPGYATDVIASHLISRGVAHRMVQKHEIAEVVERVLRPEETGATPCSLCSRLRRGVLYGLAAELGATKIALGHHLDDLCETLLLNIFYGGQISTMPPKLVSDDGKNIVIRPMAYVEERDLVAWAAAKDYSVVRCSCPTCGLPDQQRQVLKRLLAQMQIEHPRLKTQMLAAMKNVRATHLLDRSISQPGRSA
jgi:tRNA 2-thiocytidine biosynthesis protein TtcA